MNAKKCDRCKKFYLPYDPGEDLKYSNTLGLVDKTEGFYLSDREALQFDLCQDCMREAVKFMYCMTVGE